MFCNDWNLQNGDGCSDKCLVETGWTCTVLDTTPFTSGDDIFSSCTKTYLGNFRIDTLYHEQCDEGSDTQEYDPDENVYISGGCFNGWIQEDYICNPDNGQC
mgnify:CR=1 FL=1